MCSMCTPAVVSPARSDAPARVVGTPRLRAFAPAARHPGIPVSAAHFPGIRHRAPAEGVASHFSELAGSARPNCATRGQTADYRRRTPLTSTRQDFVTYRACCGGPAPCILNGIDAPSPDGRNRSTTRSVKV